MLEFKVTAGIHRPLEEVFAFFRDIDQYAGQPGSIVPQYDKITSGPVGVGTRYREVVRLLPGLYGTVLTEVTGYEPNHWLSYRYVALGMPGELTYRLEETSGEVKVIQQQSLHPRGWLRLLSPFIAASFSWMIKRRLVEIKTLLESDQGPWKKDDLMEAGPP